MKNIKKIKDPIYGYISIPIEFIKKVIDCPEFQRLRRISQTSYAPLYPSSTHNRFAHSLGVFYLGNIACEQLKGEIRKQKLIDERKLTGLCSVFVLACLLHDVGHAPFSHTGEDFYLNNNKPIELHDKLKNLINSSTFNNDVPSSNAEAAAAHEIMSAIMGIETFGYLLPDTWQKEFFARCITGYMYKKGNTENDVKNCFIGLLNSKVIDVDRLDYLIRDAYFTGYNSVNIDYKRLLSSLTVISSSAKDENDNTISKLELAFFKDAISIIENVVYAHDSERKWIQTHPTVIYESYLLQRIMTELSLLNQGLFSVEAIGSKGVQFNNFKISLLCDDDIIFLMKNIVGGTLVDEFFNRNVRRHPIWKSEPEYKAFISSTLSDASLKVTMNNLINFVKNKSNALTINKEIVESIEKEINETERNSQLDRPMKTILIKEKRSMFNLAKFLVNYAVSNNLHDCDFVALTASQFNSGFSKPDFSNINIVFNSNEELYVKKFKDVASPLSSFKVEGEKFFYLFYKRGNNFEDINKKDFCIKLSSNQIESLD